NKVVEPSDDEQEQAKEPKCSHRHKRKGKADRECEEEADVEETDSDDDDSKEDDLPETEVCTRMHLLIDAEPERECRRKHCPPDYHAAPRKSLLKKKYKVFSRGSGREAYKRQAITNRDDHKNRDSLDRADNLVEKVKVKRFKKSRKWDSL
ncbi:hypothetical protein ANCCAN_15868, partial [Ancylostoma caninum]